MPQKIILDTNAYSNFLKRDEKVREFIEAADTIYFSVIVYAELLAGAQLGTKTSKNNVLLEKFLSKPTVYLIEVGKETAEIYRDIFTDLKKQGTPIPTNDIWIAAQCIELGGKLITFDKHFTHIPGLRIELMR